MIEGPAAAAAAADDDDDDDDDICSVVSLQVASSSRICRV